MSTLQDLLTQKACLVAQRDDLISRRDELLRTLHTVEKQQEETNDAIHDTINRLCTNPRGKLLKIGENFYVVDVVTDLGKPAMLRYTLGQIRPMEVL